MRIEIIERKIYTFDELPEDTQEKAIEKLWDINVDYEWWESVYEDAAMIGLKISEFDLDRASYVKGAFLQSAEETAEAILKEHGDGCDTYATASNYLFDREKLVKRYSDGHNIDKVAEDNEYEFDQECDDLDDEFLKSLCEDYRIMLQQSYEYLTSEEAVKETIESNEYEFDEEGNIA